MPYFASCGRNGQLEYCFEIEHTVIDIDHPWEGNTKPLVELRGCVGDDFIHFPQIHRAYINCVSIIHDRHHANCVAESKNQCEVEFRTVLSHRDAPYYFGR